MRAPYYVVLIEETASGGECRTILKEDIDSREEAKRVAERAMRRYPNAICCRALDNTDVIVEEVRAEEF